MLANLNISQWTARKHDKSVSAEVDQNHNATDGGRYNKLLISKIALDPLSKHASSVRNYHYTMTLPWGDNGDRLLPSASYFEYTTKMRTLRSENEQLVLKFCSDYMNLVNEARQRLGTMYDANDYPHTDHIKERFGIEIKFRPVPAAGHFLVDIENSALEEIRKSLDAQTEEMTRGAIQECWARLQIVVQRVNETMTKDKPVFRDSLIDNLTELTDMIPKLNVTNDAALNRVCERIKDELIQPPRLLRMIEPRRRALAVASSGILQTIENHINR